MTKQLKSICNWKTSGTIEYLKNKGEVTNTRKIGHGIFFDKITIQIIEIIIVKITALKKGEKKSNIFTQDFFWKMFFD